MIAIGTKLYGFCGGIFGRDSYSEKRVEAFGVDWVVIRNDEGKVEYGDIDNISELEEYTKNPYFDEDA